MFEGSNAGMKRQMIALVCCVGMGLLGEVAPEVLVERVGRVILYRFVTADTEHNVSLFYPVYL